MYSNMSHANSDSFHFPFPFWTPFVSFSSLIAISYCTFYSLLNNMGLLKLIYIKI